MKKTITLILGLVLLALMPISSWGQLPFTETFSNDPTQFWTFNDEVGFEWVWDSQAQEINITTDQSLSVSEAISGSIDISTTGTDDIFLEFDSYADFGSMFVFRVIIKYWDGAQFVESFNVQPPVSQLPSASTTQQINISAIEERSSIRIIFEVADDPLAQSGEKVHVDNVTVYSQSSETQDPPAEPSGADWTGGIDVALDANPSINAQAVFGMDALATDAFDQDLDIPLPPFPPEGNYIDVFFDKSLESPVDWPNELNSEYSSDIRASGVLDGNTYSWVFSVESNQVGAATITIPRPVEVTVPMNVIDASMNVTTANTGDLTVPINLDGASVLEFTLTIGDVEEPVITGFESMEGPDIWDNTLSRTFSWSVDDASEITNMTVQIGNPFMEVWEENIPIYDGNAYTFDFTPNQELFGWDDFVFRITATDNAGNTAEVVTQEPVTIVDPIQYIDLFPGAWLMVGSPFKNGFTAGENTDFYADAIRYKLNSSGSSYVLSDGYEAFKGNWVGTYTPEGQEYLPPADQISGEIAGVDNPLPPLVLEAGWHMISVPLFRAVSFENVTVEIDGVAAASWDDPSLSEYILTDPIYYIPPYEDLPLYKQPGSQLSEQLPGVSGYQTEEVAFNNYISPGFFDAYWIGLDAPATLTFGIQSSYDLLAGKEAVKREPGSLNLILSDNTNQQSLKLALGEGRSSIAPPLAPETHLIGLKGRETSLGDTYISRYIKEENLDGIEIPLVVQGPEREMSLEWNKDGFDLAVVDLVIGDRVINLGREGRVDLSSTEFNNAKIVLGGVATSIDEPGMLPTELALNQNYPNPFNPSTEISYALPATSQVKLAVYNMLGQQVALLENGVKTAGSHSVRFDASKLGSGTYLYRLEANGTVLTKKMVLVK